MAKPEKNEVTTIYEWDADLERDTKAYLIEVQSLFRALPNMQSVRLLNPVGEIPYTFTPQIDRETGDWNCLRVEPNKLDPYDPTIFRIATNNITVSFASQQAELESGIGRTPREKFNFAKAYIETIIAPVRAAQSN